MKICDLTLEDYLAYEERFWSYVNIKDDINDCWEWKRFCNGYGYGRFGIRRVVVDAHRVSWILHNKTLVPPDLLVTHQCSLFNNNEPNRKCCNHHHLLLGTHSTNQKDMIRDGNSTFGEKNPNSKLKESQIKEIRTLRNKNMTYQAIGNIYGVSNQTIHLICKGKNWAHII